MRLCLANRFNTGPFLFFGSTQHVSLLLSRRATPLAGIAHVVVIGLLGNDLMVFALSVIIPHAVITQIHGWILIGGTVGRHVAINNTCFHMQYPL
nr:MAG TPA: hypothetical protein [Caudoviricetes sp.]